MIKRGLWVAVTRTWGGEGNFVEARLRLCFFGIETAFPLKKNLLNIMLFIVIPIQDTEHRNDI